MKITVQTKYGTYTHEYEDGDDDTIWELNRKWYCMLSAMGYSQCLIDSLTECNCGRNDAA